jgi:subtilisin family serine protease
MYPARYPEVIGVGALTPFGKMATYNNTGMEVDILAPGSNIISADVTNGDKYSGYGVCSGTSQAAAHVTAAIALMLATDASLTPDDIKEILRETSRPTDPWGPGQIDLTAALRKIREEMKHSRQYRRYDYYWYWSWFRFFRW